MNHTIKRLLAGFFLLLAVALAMVVLFETGVLEEGTLLETGAQGEFFVLTIMELLTIAMIPLALRLFKFKKVEAELQQRHEKALERWGALRLFMLGMPLVLNLLFYYLYLNASFGVMTLILLLCLAFVYPARSKCEAEAFMTVEA